MASSRRLTLLGLATLLAAAKGASSSLATRLSIVTSPRIINGVDTTIEEIPYQIAIESWRYPICGGAIISEGWVVTAAQCVHPDSGFLWSKRIRAGVTYEFIFSWKGSIHQIDMVRYHPYYSSNSMDYDVAVVKVANNFDFSTTVQPIQIPSIKEDEYINYDGNATVSGWGKKKATHWTRPLHLQSVTIPLVRRQRCVQLHDQGDKQVSPRMICGAGDGKGAPCFGDCGGPLVHRKQLIGLTSWERSCNDAKYPTIFTNLLDYEIRSFVKSYSGV